MWYELIRFRVPSFDNKWIGKIGYFVYGIWHLVGEICNLYCGIPPPDSLVHFFYMMPLMVEYVYATLDHSIIYGVLISHIKEVYWIWKLKI